MCAALDAEVLDEILVQLIKRGKGIELNTGGLRKLGNDFNPSREILKRYRELGGELITIGSAAAALIALTAVSTIADNAIAAFLILTVFFRIFIVSTDR